MPSDLNFFESLPPLVLAEVFSYTPFSSWGRLCMTNQRLYHLLVLNEGFTVHLYQSINYSSQQDAVCFKQAITRSNIENIFQNMKHFLKNTIYLHLKGLKGFDDSALRVILSHAPRIRHLTLSNLPLVKGFNNIRSSAKPNADQNEESESLLVDQNEASSISTSLAQSMEPLTPLEKLCCQLTSLKLHNMQVSDSLLISLSPFLQQCEELALVTSRAHLALPILGTHCKKLKVLQLDGTWKLTSQKLQEWALTPHNNMTTLSFKSIGQVTDLTLTRCLSRTAPNLTRLILNMSPMVTSIGLEAVKLTCPNLVHLGLSRIGQISPEIWTSCLSSFPLLTFVDLSLNPGVDDSCIEALSKGSPKLQNVDLRGTNISDEAIRYLATSCKNLLYLDTSDCKNVQSFPDLDTLPSFVRLASSGCPKLNLSSLHKQFQKMGTVCKFMVKVDLSWTCIDDACIRLLTQNAIWMSHVCVIGCNNLTDLTIDYIIQLLSKPTYQGAYFSFGVCATPKITSQKIRILKKMFAAKTLKMNELELIETISKADVLKILENCEEDRLTIACRRGGATRGHQTCQCPKATNRFELIEG